MYSEWYSYHFPELVKIVTDNYTYARVAQYVGNRKLLTEDKLEGLEKILLDSEKTRAIYDASRSSMGNEPVMFIGVYFVFLDFELLYLRDPVIPIMPNWH